MKTIWTQHALNRPSNLSSHAPANLPNLAARDTPAMWPAAMCKSEWHTPQYFISINLGRQPGSVEDTQKHCKEHRKRVFCMKTWCWYLVHVSYDVHDIFFNIYIKYNWLNQESLTSRNLSEQHIKVAQFSSLELHRFKRTCFIFASHVNRLHGASHLAMRWVGWLEESDLWKSSCGFSVMEFGSMKWRKRNYSVLLVAPSEETVILGIQTILDFKLNVEVQERIICSKNGRMHCDLWFRMSKNNNT